MKHILPRTVLLLLTAALLACQAPVEDAPDRQPWNGAEVRAPLLSISGDAPSATSCEPDRTFYQAPPFPYPEPEEWIHDRETVDYETGRTACNLLHDVMDRAGEPIVVHGRFVHNCDPQRPLAGEWALLYLWGTGLDGWIHLGRVLTDGSGEVHVELPPLPGGRYIIKAVIAGDLSSANGYISMLSPGRQAVAFDLDELVGALEPALEALPGTSPLERLRPDADSLVRHYSSRGFEVLFFTRRPFWTATRTRGWLASLELPFQTMRFLPGPEAMEQPASASPVTAWLREVQSRAGLDFIRAYGRTLEDIHAFEAVGVPKSGTYILGEHAGVGDTVPLEGEDALSLHLEMIDATDDGLCALSGDVGE